MAKKLKYTTAERRLKHLLMKPQVNEIDTKTLTRRFYKQRVPEYGQHIVYGILKSLMNKTAINNEPFTIEIVGPSRRGPHPMVVAMKAKE